MFSAFLWYRDGVFSRSSGNGILESLTHRDNSQSKTDGNIGFDN
jgi:hypothetical protein